MAAINYVWSGSYLVLKLTQSHVDEVPRFGPAEEAVAYLRTLPEVRAALDEIDPEALVCELRDYGAWSAAELADHEQNEARIIWLAAADIRDRPEEFLA